MQLYKVGNNTAPRSTLALCSLSSSCSLESSSANPPYANGSAERNRPSSPFLKVTSLESNSFNPLNIQSTSVKLLLGQLHLELPLPRVSAYEFSQSSWCAEYCALFLQLRWPKQAETNEYLWKFEFSHHLPLSLYTTFSQHHFLKPCFCLAMAHAQQPGTTPLRRALLNKNKHRPTR
jgi:hypothetical protein